MTFTPLRVRSHGSLLRGVVSPELLVQRALERGYESLALTDRDNLYLAIRFYRTALAEGLRPLLGAELTDGGDRRSVLLIPLDRRGYANLCAVLTARHLDASFDLTTAIADLWAGLHIVVESAGLAASLIGAGVPAAARWDVEGQRRARDGGLWIGVRGLAHERGVLADRLDAARRLHVPIVATGDVALLDAVDHEAHRAAVTAARGELLDRMPPSAFCAPEAWLASPEEWSRRIQSVCTAARRPEAAAEALANNRAIAERCRLAIELGTPIFPKAPLADGVLPAARLRELCDAGIRRRYRPPEYPAAVARLQSELAVIDNIGFTDYFMLVAAIVEYARAEGIPTVGRGSGAASIVAYVLGITNVDPVRYNLCFERFLNPSRRDCPDLDIDLCWRRRDEVIAHVYDTYGHDRVAMISTHSTLSARSAFRETAKALGVPNERVNKLSKRIPRHLEQPYLGNLQALADARDIDWREPMLTEALRLAEKLEGAPRHLGTHCGGVVIADRPLTDYVPLQRAAKNVVVTQFEMRAVEAIGLVKMDLLGNRALTCIKECVDLVGEYRDVEIDVDRLPDPDPRTAATLTAGDTLNCFQLESPAMRHLQRMLTCGTLEETIAAVALVRPGPAASGMKEAYCRRQRGLEPAQFYHPRVQSVLAATHGIMVFEEDVMHVAAALTGMSLAEGDDLRRAIAGARTDEEYRSLERGFMLLTQRSGIDKESAGAVWRDFTRFAAYWHCKGHAAGYGILGYQSAYLKTHYPAEWAVGVLNHHAGMYSTWVHVEDLRLHGAEFRAPCTRTSEWDSTLEATPESSRAVRVGLSRVYGLHERTGERILTERTRRAFVNLSDFVARVRPTLPELEALIYAGAFDWTACTRPSLLLGARVSARTNGGVRLRAGGPAAAGPTDRVVAATAWDRSGARGSGATPFTQAGAAQRAIATTTAPPLLTGPDGATLETLPIASIATATLPEFELRDRIFGECRATGLWFSGHPLHVLITPGERDGCVAAAAVYGMRGRRVSVVGLPCAYRRIETKRGDHMMFMTLADESGVVECTLLPDAYQRLAGVIRGQVIRASGRVEDTLDAITLSVEDARVLT